MYPIISRHFTSSANRKNLKKEIDRIIVLELKHGISGDERKIDVLHEYTYNSDKLEYDNKDIKRTIRF